MDLLQVKNLQISFGENVVLEDVSFTIQRGDILAIVGPNGAGKTVLIKALLGLINPGSGEILKKEGLQIGYAPQKFEFDRGFPITVEEFMLMQSGGSIFFPKSDQKERIVNLLKEVGAEEHLKKRMGELSGGQLQRILIASALAGDPDIVYLDEPSAGVDIGGEETMYHLLDELHQSRGLTLVIVSHDIDFVYREATQVLCLNKRNMCFGIPEEALTEETLKRVFREKVTPYHHKE